MSRTTSDATEVILTSANEESWNVGVWDPRNGCLLSTFKSVKSALAPRSLQLLGDSYVIGADSAKPRVYVWPLNKPSLLPDARLTTSGRVNALCCTPNGSYVIAAVSETLHVWQTCTGRPLASLSGHYQTVTCLSITKDGSLFASGGEDAHVFVWSLYSAINDKSCSPLHSFPHHSQPVRDLRFGHGGIRARLYTVSQDRVANVYELGSGNMLLSVSFDAPLTAVAVNILDSELFVGCATGDIFQCNLHEPPREIKQHENRSEKREEVAFRAHKSNVTALSVTVDCGTLLSGSTDGAVHVWDIASRQVLRTLKHKGAVTAAFFAPYYENFRTATLRPRLKVANLPLDGDKEIVLEVVSRGRDPKEILDFESYVRGEVVDARRSEETSKKLNDMRDEIERLKTINAELYRYSVKSILNINDD